MASSYHDVLADARAAKSVPCDFRKLKDALTLLRRPEDNVRYRLNRSHHRHARTGSEVSCEQLWADMDEIRRYRLSILQKCESEYDAKLRQLESVASPTRQQLAEKDRIKFERGFLQTESLFEESLKVSTLYNFEQSCGDMSFASK